jgi:O-antigen biosynthesis protein
VRDGGENVAGDEERRSLQARVVELEKRAQEAEGLRREAEELRQELQRTRRELERRERALERAREDAAGELAVLRARLVEANRTLHSVTRSRAWKLIELYRSNVKRRLLPPGSRRHRLYSRLLGTGDYRPATDAASGPALPPGEARRVVRETFLPPPLAGASVEALAAKVSVVIPTLNAGSEFRAVLERLRAQRGLAALEIVAVDSGSTDGTPALCERHSVRVVPYPGGPFNHGVARNTGADAASGEFLVFMSQDVIPVGDDAIARLVRTLQSDPQLAAASARQVPRSDADVFTCWQLWGYREKVLGYSRDTVVGVDAQQLAALPPEQRRRAAQIDNVLACLRREAFDRHHFQPRAIAEDLDLGLRLLEDGYRIAFLSSVAAIHSHNRTPAYHLRRGFTEWMAMVELLGFDTLPWQVHQIPSIEGAVRAAAGLYRRVGNALAAAPHGNGGAALEAVARVRAALTASPAGDFSEREESIESVLHEIAAACGLAEPLAASARCEPFLQLYLDASGSLAEYLAAARVLDTGDGELRTALFKLCTDVIGRGLADHAIWHERQHHVGGGYPQLVGAMSRGV